MCYSGCAYESYPYGQNEGCYCRKPPYVACSADEEISEIENALSLEELEGDLDYEDIFG